MRAISGIDTDFLRAHIESDITDFEWLKNGTINACFRPSNK